MYTVYSAKIGIKHIQTEKDARKKLWHPPINMHPLQFYFIT